MTKEERILSSVESTINAVAAVSAQVDDSLKRCAVALETLVEQHERFMAATAENAKEVNGVRAALVDERGRNEAAHANIRNRLLQLEQATNGGR